MFREERWGDFGGRVAAITGAGCTRSLLDVADRDAVFAWAQACRETCGQVNLAFNNAGVALAAPAANDTW